MLLLTNNYYFYYYNFFFFLNFLNKSIIYKKQFFNLFFKNFIFKSTNFLDFKFFIFFCVTTPFSQFLLKKKKSIFFKEQLQQKSINWKFNIYENFFLNKKLSSLFFNSFNIRKNFIKNEQFLPLNLNLKRFFDYNFIYKNFFYLIEFNNLNRFNLYYFVSYYLANKICYYRCSIFFLFFFFRNFYFFKKMINKISILFLNNKNYYNYFNLTNVVYKNKLNFDVFNKNFFNIIKSKILIFKNLNYFNFLNYFFKTFFEFLFLKKLFLNFYFWKNMLIVFKKYDLFKFLNFKFKKMQHLVGKGFFLNELLEIIFILFLTKDSNFFLNWMIKTMERIYFKNHKKFLYFLKILLTRYFINLLYFFNCEGFHFDIRGKIGVTGNAKKRHYSFSLGKFSFTTKKNKISVAKNVLRTNTGVLGVTFILLFN